MLSFAIVYAGLFDGKRFVRPSHYDSVIYKELKPISNDFDPEALRINGLDRNRLLIKGDSPEHAMTEACRWVTQIAGKRKPVLVAYPLSFDWTWLYWYFVKYSKMVRHLAIRDVLTSRRLLQSRLVFRFQKPVGPGFVSRCCRDEAILIMLLMMRLSRRRSLPMSSSGTVDSMELDSRRNWTRGRIKGLQRNLQAAADMAADKACVYMTGSFGRGEASVHSDLDLFILGKVDSTADKSNGRMLRQLDEICIKADLIQVTRKLQMPPFSGDGEYLVHYSVEELTRTLGTQDDDRANTFTARLLLLLESQVLFGEGVYNEAIEEVVAAYWRDYEDHKDDFVPAFLGNDILRLWRTFCVNCEARTKREPVEDKAKGKLKNYKLKHSRLLTCYSALLQMLTIYGKQKTIGPRDMLSVVRLAPTERLDWMRGQKYLKDAEKTLGNS